MYLLKVVIFAVPAPKTNINRLQFLFDQLLNVVDLNSERYSIVVQEGGETAEIFISDFDINRLQKLAWLPPEINLWNEMKFLLVESGILDLETESWAFGIRILSSTDEDSRIHYLKFGIHSVDPESKFFLDYQLRGAHYSWEN